MSRFLQLIFYTAVAAISVVSLLPAEAFPKSAGGDGVQVVGHVTAYALLALLGLLAHRGNRARLGVFVGLALLGVCLELGQMLSPGRYANMDDIYANLIGISAVFIPAEAVVRRRMRRLRKVS